MKVTTLPRNCCAISAKSEISVSYFERALLWVQGTGIVNFSSPATTPHLRLFVVWYTQFTDGYVDDGLLGGTMPAVSKPGTKPIVDGVSLWLDGISQNAQYAQWTQQFEAFRTKTSALRSTAIGPLAVYGGSYVEHSSVGILDPYPFWDMFNASIDLYEAAKLEGFFIFAGTSIPKLNHSMWNAWDIEGNLNTLYQPYLGSACGSVARAGPGVRVNVRFSPSAKSDGDSVAVATKLTNRNGTFCFQGWTGRNGAAPHIVSLEDQTSRMAIVQLIAGQEVSFHID
eukprot:INCI6279.1.p1 GENE.INCI6279.1~~INCI6279.1.p1  ORF type:complete len:284 (+),score=41.07 INCI6279.1:40-891(+)